MDIVERLAFACLELLCMPLATKLGLLLAKGPAWPERRRTLNSDANAIEGTYLIRTGHPRAFCYTRPLTRLPPLVCRLLLALRFLSKRRPSSRTMLEGVAGNITMIRKRTERSRYA